MVNKVLHFFSNDKDPSNAEGNQKVNKVLIFTALVIVCAALLLMVDGKKKEPKRDIGSFKIIEEDKMAKTRWVGDAAVDLKLAKKKVDTLDKDNDHLAKEVSELKKMIGDLKQAQDKAAKENGENNPRGTKKDQPFPSSVGKELYQNYPKPNDGQSGAFGISQLGSVPDVEKKEIVRYKRYEGALEVKAVAKPNDPPVKKEKRNKDLLSTGTIIPAVLMSGMDAPTMSAAKTAPLPVVLKVTDLSILPNRWKFDIKGCFLTGEGYGDLPSERAYIRINNLSCVKNNGQHIDMPIKGNAVGEDGKSGLKGVVVTKAGALLARTLVAGFLQGVGDAFTKQNQVVLTGTNGVTTTTKDISAGDALQMGAFGGLSKSAEKLSDFYLKMADQVYPVIEIGADRLIDVMLVEMAELKTLEDNETQGKTKK